MSVDEVINNAEALINGTEVNYTEASMNSLKDALSSLKKIKAAYTTDKDPMLADIVIIMVKILTECQDMVL